MIRTLRTLLLMATLLATTGALAGPYSNLFIFGDSLSDTGNLAAANGGSLPPLPVGSGFNGPYYQNTHLSDGPVWVEHLATGLGLSPLAAAPSLLGGNNYAFAGAQTGTGSTPPGVLAQIAGPRAFGLWGGNPVDQAVADPFALYVVVAGGNDMRAARSTFSGNSAADIAGRQQAAADAITNLANSIGLLASLGARNFLLSNLPDLGYTPEAGLLGLQAASTDASARFNALLPVLMGFGLQNGLNMHLLDMAGLTSDLVNDPLYRASVGITNVSQPCAGFEYSSGDACSASLFADVLHPSARAHTLIARAALDTLGIPEPGSLALIGLAVLTLAVVRRRRERRGEQTAS